MDSTFEPTQRWYHPRPTHLVLALFAVQGLLMLSERYRWFDFNRQPGCAVLIALAAVAAFLVVFLFWFAGSLLFRWRFQYGLRLLPLLVVAVAVPGSWLAVEITSERNEWQVAKALEAVGGLAAMKQTCIGRLLRDDSLVTVHTMHFIRKTATDADLARCQCLNRLQFLNLDHTQVTDEGLMHLRGLNQLRTLFLDGTHVTDEGLAHLRGLGSLRTLSLNDTNITDAGLKNLADLRHLSMLELEATRVTDAGLAHLSGLSELFELGLTNTKVTANGVSKLNQSLPACQIYVGQKP
jgi:hypothetical protein